MRVYPLPTGNHDAKDSDGNLINPSRAGTGWWGPFAGIHYRLEQGDWIGFASLSYRLRTEATHFDHSKYKFGDAVLRSVGEQGVKPSFTVGVQYQVFWAGDPSRRGAPRAEPAAEQDSAPALSWCTAQQLRSWSGNHVLAASSKQTPTPSGMTCRDQTHMIVEGRDDLRDVAHRRDDGLGPRSHRTARARLHRVSR